ncbi:CBM9 family sugar-binding protein [Planctobacterium marinum]|uniref:CBM9 family sugar-binding protein n=1 Tax=Planctobacterium marinum TaxID=1631968 RepID=UPI001E3ED7A9|nr:CBM9 family sugar-binding protein [Planctobacterium marinum]MCC2606711.1 CBM9 family sugar-binding protein [Planctobacterium marinum]
MTIKRTIFSLLMINLIGTTSAAERIGIRHTAQAPVIDGQVDELWQQAPWWPLDNHILGDIPDKADFSGRFKLLWDEGKLYLLAEIQDDVLADHYPNPKTQYWDDDCLEIFIDSDASGGNHLYTHNAFAYHIALDNQVADIGENRGAGENSVVLLNHHLKSRWQRTDSEPYPVIWEVAMNLYPDAYSDAHPLPPLALKSHQDIGFMLAYCDADGQGYREHFYGSTAIQPVDGDKNLGYINADVFGQYQLQPTTTTQK